MRRAPQRRAAETRAQPSPPRPRRARRRTPPRLRHVRQSTPASPPTAPHALTRVARSNRRRGLRPHRHRLPRRRRVLMTQPRPRRGRRGNHPHPSSTTHQSPRSTSIVPPLGGNHRETYNPDLDVPWRGTRADPSRRGRPRSDRDPPNNLIDARVQGHLHTFDDLSSAPRPKPPTKPACRGLTAASPTRTSSKTTATKPDGVPPSTFRRAKDSRQTRQGTTATSPTNSLERMLRTTCSGISLTGIAKSLERFKVPFMGGTAP